MTTREMEVLLLEITNGVPAPAHESEERRAMRARLTREVAEIRARGGVVDLPPEVP